MGRILGVDLGARRVGLALTDPLRTFASPYATVSYTSESGLVDQIASLCAEKEIDLVVIGMPYEPGGRESEGCARSRRIREKLSAGGIKAVLHDETWTSRDAAATLRESGKNRRNAKGAVDRIAASLILKDYLEQAGGDRDG